MKKIELVILFLIINNIFALVPMLYIPHYNNSNIHTQNKIIPYETNEIWTSLTGYKYINLYDESKDRIVVNTFPFKVDIFLQVKLGNKIKIKIYSYDSLNDIFENVYIINYTSTISLYTFSENYIIINEQKYSALIFNCQPYQEIELYDYDSNQKYVYPEFMLFDVYTKKLEIPKELSLKPAPIGAQNKYSNYYTVELPDSGYGYKFRIYNVYYDSGENHIHIFAGENVFIDLMLYINEDQSLYYAKANVHVGSNIYASNTLSLSSSSWKDVYFHVYFFKDKIYIVVDDTYSNNNAYLTAPLGNYQLKTLIVRYCSKTLELNEWTYGTVYKFHGKIKYSDDNNWFSPLINWFRTLYSNIKSFFVSIWKGLISNIISFINKVKIAINNIFNKITELLSYFTTEFTQFFQNTIQFFNNFYTSYIEPFINWLKNNIIELWNTINSFVEFMKNIFTLIRNGLNFLFDVIDSGIQFMSAVMPFVLNFGGVFFALWLLSPLFEGDIESFIEKVFQLEDFLMKIFDLAVKIFNAIVNLINMLRNMIPFI